MSAQLVPLNAGSTPSVPIVKPVLLIGRHPECDIRIDSPQISRRHCCVAIAYDRVVIRDLGSRHGVRVNGMIIDEAHHNLGDEIAIGHFLYRLENLAPVASGASGSKPVKPARDQDLGIDFDDEDLIPLD
jgi:pSer/pThr/pTyr-binding forkhead associated (FHA) protein